MSTQERITMEMETKSRDGRTPLMTTLGYGMRSPRSITSVRSSRVGAGFRTNEQVGIRPGARPTGFGVNFANGSQRGGTWDLDRALREARDGGVSIFANWEESETDFFSQQQTLPTQSQPPRQTRCPPYPDYPQNADLDAKSEQLFSAT